MTDYRRVACATLALAAAIWVALLVTAPWTAAAAGSVGGWLYAVGSLICHQRPERSFHLGAAQLPVCARCLGLYAGGAAGAIAWAMASPRVRRVWPARSAVIAVAVTGAPTAVTAIAASLALCDPSNAWRATLAVPLGAVGGLVAGALTTDHLK
jgi:uncharacterized membrane protein